MDLPEQYMKLDIQKQPQEMITTAIFLCKHILAMNNASLEHQ